MSSRRQKIPPCFALCGALIAMGAAVHAQVAGDTQDIGPPTSPPLGQIIEDAYLNDVPIVTDFVTLDSNGAVLDVVEGRMLKVGENNKETRKAILNLTRNKKLSDTLRNEGLEEADRLLKESKDLADDAKFVKKVNKVLNIINIVAVGAKTFAYIVEGDFTGATGVVLQEGTKKAMEAGGTALAGPLVGTVTGEAIFTVYVKDELEAREDAVRNREFAEKYLNKPWLTPTLVMDEKGRVRELEPDMYVEKGTGMIRRRSPEEQAAFEAGQKIRWKDARTWNKIIKDFAEGKISKERYDELLEAYRNRDPLVEWDPDATPSASLYSGSYAGRFSGGAAGSVRFSVKNGNVSGTMSGTCKVSVCSGEAISASFSGSVNAQGLLKARMTGKVVGNDYGTFGGSFEGLLTEDGGSGGWTGMNEYGGGDGRWSAPKGN